jgi:hypothetical protein
LIVLPLWSIMLRGHCRNGVRKQQLQAHEAAMM